MVPSPLARENNEAAEAMNTALTCRKQMVAGVLFAALAIVSATAGDVRAAIVCVGDCDGNGTVAITELIAGVDMALGTTGQNQCPSFDTDQRGSVTIAELITAVNNALHGCPPDTSGVLLQGPADMPAVDATTDRPPVAVDASEIENGVIMTRLDLHLTPGAAVGQVNAALALVHGGVVSMLHGYPTLTIAIPRPADLDALATVVQTLRAASGISWTAIAHVADPKVLPPSPAGNNQPQLSHLLPTRFPAAWNASQLATEFCAARKVRLLVADIFQRPPLTGAYANFLDEIPEANFTLSGGRGPADETHGYDVTTTLAALFNTTNPTGANPFSDCLEIDAIQLSGLTESQRLEAIALKFPPGKFLLNYSIGYRDKLDQTIIDDCTANGCTASQVETEIGALPLTRAYDGADWISLTANRSDDFLLSVAAGNEADEAGTAVYRGLGIAVFDSGMSVATLLPDDGFLFDGFLWNAPPGFPGFPKLTASATEMEAFERYMQAAGLAAAGSAKNVLIVGSTKPGCTFDALADPVNTRSPLTDGGTTAGCTFDALLESDFSDTSDPEASGGPDLLAVGEEVFALGGFTQGTSFAAPQVAGLASYLWLLSPDLQSRPIATTRRAILANVDGFGAIDAYAAALSLDAAVLPTAASAPIRLAILNVNVDGDSRDRFDEADLDTFLDKLFTGNETRDFGRFDLNGDGFTGGSTREYFDLDRVGSTQFGATRYSTVTQSIEGETVSFDENQLTDLDILCYYAYSDLYKGDLETRTQLTAGHCTIAVTITPSAVTLPPGGSQQFGATVRGTADPRVTWRVVSGGGSIDATGLFTAGPSAGTSVVRATSVVDPGAFADATVQVSAVQVLAGQLGFMEDAPGLHSALSAFVRVEARADGTVAVLEATGSLSSVATGEGGCTDPNSPDPNNPNIVHVTFDENTQSITFDGGKYTPHAPGPNEDLLELFSSGTVTNQRLNIEDCSFSTVVSEISGSTSLIGTPVLQNGHLVAIDFNHDFSIEGDTRLQTGRLELQP